MFSLKIVFSYYRMCSLAIEYVRRVRQSGVWGEEGMERKERKETETERRSVHLPMI